jgi:hypothetical protein
MKSKKPKQKKLNSFLSKFKKKERYIIKLSLFLLIFFSILTYLYLFLINNEQKNLEIIEIKDNIVREDIENKADIKLSPKFLEENLVALILDNDPKNRYPIGLEKASLIYEVPTEGGSSRFLAIFSSDIELESIGPIRSARPYIIDLAQNFSALLIHCGGSPQALAQLAQERIISLNEFYNGSYFWRDKNLKAPNNIYISSNSWQKFLDNQKLEQLNTASWKFIDENHDLETVELEHENIFVNYSKNYQRNWQYNRELNLYEIKGDKNKISVKNLIFHYANSKVLDDQLRLEINLLGEGKAVICQLGFCYEGTWQKNTKAEKIKYYDKNGDELNFLIGNSWISIISSGAYINY